MERVSPARKADSVLRECPCCRGGYTLAEMLVVLVVIALAAGVAFPRAASLYRSLVMAFERDAIVEQLSAVGFNALIQHREYRLVELPSQAADAPPVVLPEGWSLLAETPIRYYRNGVCTGGQLTLSYGEVAARLALDPPYCAPKIVVKDAEG